MHIAVCALFHPRRQNPRIVMDSYFGKLQRLRSTRLEVRLYQALLVCLAQSGEAACFLKVIPLLHVYELCWSPKSLPVPPRTPPFLQISMIDILWFPLFSTSFNLSKPVVHRGTGFFWWDVLPLVYPLHHPLISCFFFSCLWSVKNFMRFFCQCFERPRHWTHTQTNDAAMSRYSVLPFLYLYPKIGCWSLRLGIRLHMQYMRFRPAYQLLGYSNRTGPTSKAVCFLTVQKCHVAYVRLCSVQHFVKVFRAIYISSSAYGSREVTYRGGYIVL